jgi:hypothetical protein
MADARQAQTTTIGGGAAYAKVAERLKLFRSDHGHSKQESAYEVDVDGSLVFTVWLWKDKTDLIELMKSGVTDQAVLRGSADANGNAKGTVGSKEKDFEKLESVALGRALANLGYLASGEIASFEEMEAFEEYQEHQRQEAVAEAVETLNNAKTMDELKKAFVATNMMENPLVVAAKDKRKSELAKIEKTEAPKTTTAMKTPKQDPATPLDTPAADPQLPIDEGQPDENS